MSAEKNTLIARAIDVGYGQTKFTTLNAEAGFGCKAFPSLAPTVRANLNVGGGVLGRNEIIQVDVEGGKFVVGKDVGTAAPANTRRVLDREYPTTTTYMALLYGALFYMRQPTIDVLVLGLPLTTYESHGQLLTERVQGKHKIPNFLDQKLADKGDLIEVTIHKVVVLPQPVGAFFNYSLPRNLYKKMAAQNNLVLDFGHGTFDWFLAHGNRPITARCDGYEGGVSKIVETIAKAIGTGHNNFNVLDLIDRGLRTNEEVQIGGRTYNIRKEFAAQAQSAMRDAISAMMQSVGDFDDVNNIIATGGGAPIYIDEVRRAIPDRKIEVDEDPIVSNVCGFQYVGQQMAADMELKRA